MSTDISGVPAMDVRDSRVSKKEMAQFLSTRYSVVA